MKKCRHYWRTRQEWFRRDRTKVYGCRKCRARWARERLKEGRR